MTLTPSSLDLTVVTIHRQTAAMASYCKCRDRHRQPS